MDISGNSIVTGAAIPPPGAQFTVSGSVTETFTLGPATNLEITLESPTEVDVTSTAVSAGHVYAPVTMILRGVGFTFDGDGDFTGGTLTGFSVTLVSPNAAGALVPTSLTVSQLSIPISTFGVWIDAADSNAVLNGILGGADLGVGSPADDVLRGFNGDDTLSGQQGYDSIFGGNGADVIYGRNAGDTGPIDLTEQNYLRGDDGNDSIVGAGSFDDVNGNAGNDTVATGAGDDWAVGGKDNDSLSGEAGGDVVWGNLGNDTQDGGDGDDQVRGGQGDDTITGGAGNDFVSGDRGNDTIAGGAGADLFHGSQDAGIDRVIDFGVSDGDRVMLDPGTTYTLSQVGADTVIDMGGGHQMILVGITMSSLPVGWIL
jgi:Ca2+-binding RTX toxin-like protein